MSGPDAPPADIEALASARSEARAARDFALADELKARIEAAGWRVVDDGPIYTLAPARPPDRREVDRIVYGSAATVPSRLEEPAQGGATAIVLVADREETSATVRGLVASTTQDVDIVVVADASTPARSALIDGLAEAAGARPVEVGSGDDHAAGRRIEILWTVDGMSHGEMLEAAIRRASGGIVVVVEAGAVPEGDLLPPIEAALRDEAVAAVGSEGLSSADLHRFELAAADGPVTALGPTLIAFRRADASRLQGIDARLTGYEGLVAWSTLALREAQYPSVTRRAVVAALPIRPRPESTDGDGDRGGPVARRDRYRVAARFDADPELAS